MDQLDISANSNEKSIQPLEVETNPNNSKSSTKVSPLLEVNTYYDIFVDDINNLNIKLKQHRKKIKDEYKNNLIIEKEKFLKEICLNENLDFNIMKSKYLPKNNSNNTTASIINEKNITILNKIIINEVEYYYNSNKDNSIVYNNKLQNIGYYKNNEIIFN